MKDATARLAARLARVEGKTHPMAWVEVYESHTPYEWMIQQVLAVVDPWGDDRADFRAAVNTLNLMPLTENDNRVEILQNLTRYLKIDEAEELHDSDAMRLMLEKINVQ